MAIKIKPVKCPECGAPILNESGRPQLFCAYCGQRLSIDDGVKRTEHTYHKIDEARIREAEARVKMAEVEAKRESARIKQEAAKARWEAIEAGWNLFSRIITKFFPLLFIAILLFSCRAMYGALEKSNEKRAIERAEEEALQEAKEKNISSQILPICKKNTATIKYLSVYNDSVLITIIASGGSKEYIDFIQNEIVSNLVLEEGTNATISIDYPEYHTLRCFEIDEYGQLRVLIDKTNSISEEESKNLLAEYEDLIKPILADHEAELQSCKYEGDVLSLEIKSSTSKKSKIEKITNDIIDLNQSLKSLSMEIWFKNKSDETLRRVEIGPDNSINITSDHTR